MDASAPDATADPDRVPASPAPDTDTDADAGEVFLVPFRWWRQCQSQPEESSSSSSSARSIRGAKGIAYTATASASSSSSSSSYYKIINNIIFSSDLAFDLRRDREGPVARDATGAAAEADEGISGRSYALIASDMWSHALRWHGEVASEAVVYTLKLRVSVLQDANVISVKISKKENAIESYKWACKIFSVDSEMVRIWDFSGRTNLILMDEWNRMAQDSQSLGDKENLLELQVYAISESAACRNEGKKDDSQSKMTCFPYGCQLLTNGSIGNMNSDVCSSGSSKVLGSLGLNGLENLGNTCFMNSAIQCLAHTPKLVEFFLANYSGEINHHNPLGMNGELALAFGELLRKLWAPDRTPVAPRVFKGKLARFAPQFCGYNQHDSQELLAFLLDGLHEDLNRVKCKPYIEVKDACGRADEEVADEYWSNHLARNDSIIVDICQGQYRSTLVCPVCKKVSVTFDPFMYLSLPLPSSATRTMTITVFTTDGSAGPSSYTITVPKFGKCKDLMQALSIACSLRDDENLLIAEVYNSRIIRYLEDINDSISLIRDGDCLAAYRILKDLEELPLVIFTHQRMDRSFSLISSQKAFGAPLVARLPSLANGCTLREMYLKLLEPFLRSPDAASATDQGSDESRVKEVSKTEISSSMPECEGTVDAIEGRENAESEFQYYVTDEKCKMMLSKIEMDEPILSKGFQKQLYVLVCWQDKAQEDYDICLLNSLPEIYKPGLFAKRIQEPISLYACLEAFLKEEPLGPEDMWYCPYCKEHQQASKKLDLWRLPEVLVIHLKRFSYSRFMKNKLEALVDFPIHKLDLSGYIAHKTNEVSHCYNLYAISNHYGNMGGGHYTAYVYHEGQKCWYDFDDRHVNPIPDETTIKTSAAYVLFYQKVQTSNPDTDSTTAAEPEPEPELEP